MNAPNPKSPVIKRIALESILSFFLFFFLPLIPQIIATIIFSLLCEIIFNLLEFRRVKREFQKLNNP